MSEYQVLARKYRPQAFSDVLGQDAVVQTLKNAVKNTRIAQAYLFCGSRGTGKTSIARIFAKALNCLKRSEDLEPCNTCSSCKEITAGHSLDVLEIDGASNRGIDDVRQINETVAYSTASGKFKIYIIDEVHMLTKEAFNALLKTLEEPPPNVKFLFATTEPHKVLPTILSRCQQFHLRRFSLETILNKLRHIAEDLNLDVEEGALHLIAHAADGGMRDAESIFDQIISFHEGRIEEESVARILGMTSRELFFQLDQEAKKGNLSYAFTLAEEVFSQGKSVTHFIDSLTEHFRTLLGIHLSGPDASFLALSSLDRERYRDSAQLYSSEQCLYLLDYLIEAQSKLKFSISQKISLEMILLHVIRSHQRVPIEFLIKRLHDLESRLSDTGEGYAVPTIQENRPVKTQATVPTKPVEKKSEALPIPPKEVVISEEKKVVKPPEKKKLIPPPTPEKKAKVPEAKKAEKTKPTLADAPEEIQNNKNRYETLLQFTAVELEGTVKR